MVIVARVAMNGGTFSLDTTKPFSNPITMHMTMDIRMGTRRFTAGMSG